jgi:type II secretory pathway pseudopilin PulG
LTLLEMLVVAVVVGILIGVLGVRYVNAKRTAYVSYMQAELRNLLTAQEAYFATTSAGMGVPRYADSLRKLGFVPRPEVTIEIRTGATGWTARAASVELPGDYSCAVYVGDVEPFEPASEEGVIACVPESRSVI